MYPRKAQGLSVSTLIIVALGVLVLILGIVFFTDITDRSRTTINTCSNLGGVCQDTPCTQGSLENRLGDCGDDRYCCT